MVSNKKPRQRIEEPYERNIITYYFADTDEYFEIQGSRRYAKYPRSAVQRALDSMSMNLFGAMVCVVYDDYFGEDHAIITRSIAGEINVRYLRDQTKPEVAGTSKDPFGGDFVRKIAKSWENRKVKPTDEVTLQKLRIKTRKS